MRPASLMTFAFGASLFFSTPALADPPADGAGAPSSSEEVELSAEDLVLLRDEILRLREEVGALRSELEEREGVAIDAEVEEAIEVEEVEEVDHADDPVVHEGHVPHGLAVLRELKELKESGRLDDLDDLEELEKLQYLEELDDLEDLEIHLSTGGIVVDTGLRGEERTSYGGDIHIRAGEKVPEAVAFGADVIIDGHVTGDAAAFGGNIRVNDGGRVDGDAVSFGGNIDVAPGARINGDSVSFGGVVRVDDGGHVRGNRVNMAASKPFTAVTQGAASSFLSGLYNKLIFLLSLAGAGVLVVGLFPNRVGAIATRIEEHPIRSAIWGTFLITVFTFMAGLFAITLLGIPVAFLLVALLGLAWLMGFVGLCQAVGDRLPFASKPHGRWLAFLVGVVLVAFLGALPFIGWLAVSVASVLGVGAAFSTRFGKK